MISAVESIASCEQPSFLTRLWGLRNGRRFSSVLLRRIGLSSLFKIRTNGVMLRFYPAVWNLHLWEDPSAFSEDTTLLKRYLRKGETMIDAGANIGLLTLVAAKVVGNEGLIYSIEAHPRTYRFLCGNIALNKTANIRHFNVALGNATGTISFSNQHTDDGNHVVPAGEGLTVPVERLDSLVDQEREIALLKMDVEGYEKLVFEGATRTLQRTKCIYFESSELLFNRYGYSCHQLFENLNNVGFTVFRIAGEEVHPLRTDYSSSAIENLIAIRDIADFIQRTGYLLHN